MNGINQNNSNLEWLPQTIIKEITEIPAGSKKPVVTDAVTAIVLNYLGYTTRVPSGIFANNHAMDSFWTENHAKLEADPGISPYIEACRNSMPPGTTWEGLKNYQKLTKLFLLMNDGLTAADIPTFGHALDYSFYNDSAQFKALDRVRPGIAAALPETAGFSTRQLRAFLNDPANAERIQTITDLDLSGLGLSILPSEIYNFTNLTVLDLYNNRLKSIPSVERFANLTQLSLMKNRITTVAAVTFPAGLRDLYLDENQITTLAGATFPAGLSTLGLFYNQITALDNAALPAGLENIGLAGNQITTLAGVIFPAGLLGLCLRQNQLTTLAGAVFPNGLKQLYLAENQITTIVGSNLPAGLRSLYLQQNPIPVAELDILRLRLVHLENPL